MNLSDEAILKAIERQQDPEADGPHEEDESDITIEEEEEENNSGVETSRAQLVEDSVLRQKLGVGGSFTGPKGVVNDYKFHKQQELGRQAAKRRADYNKLSKAALSSGWMGRQLQQEQLTDEFAELEDDGFMKEYRERRLQQMMKFGAVIELETDDYVSAIDDEDASVTLVIHLYQESLEACRRVNSHLDVLARRYPQVKFARIVATKADSSFENVVLPALLVYRGGALVHTLLRITDDLRARSNKIGFDDFEAYLHKESVLLTGSVATNELLEGEESE